MFELKESVSLKSLNTFGIDASSRYFTEIGKEEDLVELLKSGLLSEMLHLVLGGGSNILFTADFPGIVVRIANKGIEVISEGKGNVLVTAAAGEEWHGFVQWCISHGFGGLENLSLIPGNVGSSPIQNIGAYGVEIKDTFHSLEAYAWETGEKLVLDHSACRFGYRDSIFKQEMKKKLIIWNVTFRLELEHTLNLGYGAITRELQEMGIARPGIRDVSEAVCRIRRSKLPDPAVTGNAGSFFKNPSVTDEKAAELQQNFPGMVCYPQPGGTVKLAAGWLIEQCNWKGYRDRDAGVHPNQALVLVNYGNANGKDILDLAGKIRDSVYEKFGVTLETEVNIV